MWLLVTPVGSFYNCSRRHPFFFFFFGRLGELRLNVAVRLLSAQALRRVKYQLLTVRFFSGGRIDALTLGWNSTTIYAQYFIPYERHPLDWGPYLASFVSYYMMDRPITDLRYPDLGCEMFMSAIGHRLGVVVQWHGALHIYDAIHTIPAVHGITDPQSIQ